MNLLNNSLIQIIILGIILFLIFRNNETFKQILPPTLPETRLQKKNRFDAQFAAIQAKLKARGNMFDAQFADIEPQLNVQLAKKIMVASQKTASQNAASQKTASQNTASQNAASLKAQQK